MDTDFLVLGSGIAGLSFALRAAELGRVTVMTKKQRIDSATNLAQGGIAAVIAKEDRHEFHIEDTLRSGAGLCDREIVKMVVADGGERIRDLMRLGVRFVHKASGMDLDLGKEGGHSHRRVAHAYDLTGKEIERAMLDAVKGHENIEVLDNHAAVDLLIHEGGGGDRRCVGAYVLRENPQEVFACRARYTVLCTGGCGKVYLYTSNPDISTGDGMAMAFRAGARMANMEFVQFHPTCLYHPQAKNFLISEAVRGEGAVLVDGQGKRFMQKYDDRGELATRDTVARAIDKEMKERGLDCVYLDIRSKSEVFLRKRFPTIYARCQDLGIHMAKEPIPVVPAAHYMCGGVMVDKHGQSSVEGLMVLGESANTGLHGGNRLASNSLLEAVVFAEKAFKYCQANIDGILQQPLPDIDHWSAGEAIDLEEEVLIHHNWDLIRRTMWNYVGIVRKTQRLQLAKQRMKDILREIEEHYRNYHLTVNMVELRNISIVAMMIIEAALHRKESRGLHFILDYPEKNDRDLHWNIFQRQHFQDEWQVRLVDRYTL